MIIYNFPGLLFLLLGFGLAFLGLARGWWSGPLEVSFHVIVGLAIAAMDLAYRVVVVRPVIASQRRPTPQLTSRLRHRGDENSWLTSSAGGSLGLYSAWIFGTGYAVIVGLLIKLAE